VPGKPPTHREVPEGRLKLARHEASPPPADAPCRERHKHTAQVPEGRLKLARHEASPPQADAQCRESQPTHRLSPVGTTEVLKSRQMARPLGAWPEKGTIRDFYSTIRKSRNPYISMKTNDRCQFYSTMNRGVFNPIRASTPPLPARPRPRGGRRFPVRLRLSASTGTCRRSGRATAIPWGRSDSAAATSC
jgi:hypothetical protein